MTKTILVADDSKTIQQVVALTFRATDFRVIPASDADEALRRLSEVKPDLVLADVAMPGRTGYELCSQIKSAAATAGIPVLLLSGSVEPFDDRRAQEARADGHIKKPFDSQALIERVRSLTSGQPAAEAPASPPPAARPVPVPAEPAPRLTSTAPRSVPFPGVGLGSDLAASPPGRPAPAAEPNPPASPPMSPFGPPRQEVRNAGPAMSQATVGGLSAPPPVFGGAAAKVDARVPAPRSETLQIEEPEIIEDAEVFDDGENAQGLSLESTVPSLEPPAPPADARSKPNVDMWALADSPAGRKEPPAPAARAHDPRANGDDGFDRVAKTAQAIGRAAAEPVALASQSLVPGLPKEQLVTIAREVIERIAWEVVPDLAETIIRAELDRLLKDKGL